MRSRCADINGINSSDEMSEQISASEIVIPTSPSQTIKSVLPRISGRKTMRLVSVEATTAMVTDRAPCSAAFFGSGSSMWRRSMASRTTIALSTSMPTPSINPIIESRFSDLPMKCIMPQAAMIEKGIESDTISVESIRRRKK